MTHEVQSEAEKFEREFIDGCKPMRITATLRQVTLGAQPIIWARDEAYHLSGFYCGCDDVAVIRTGKQVYTHCAAHRVQLLGRAIGKRPTRTAKPSMRFARGL